MGIFGKKKVAPARIVESIISEHDYQYEVVGCQFVQDDKLTGHKIIGSLLADRDFINYTDCHIKFDTYKGKECIKVYAVDSKGQEWHIGYIAEKKINTFKGILNDNNNVVGYLQFNCMGNAWVHLCY